MGGTWLGVGQDGRTIWPKMLGVTTYPTYVKGDSVIGRNGKALRYKGLIPKIGPLALASLALGMARLDAMAKKVPVDAPWTRRAPRRGIASAPARGSCRECLAGAGRDLLLTTVRGLMSSDPSEVSLLHVLFLIRSANGLNVLLSVEGGYEEDMMTGGAGAMAATMAADLGDAGYTSARQCGPSPKMRRASRSRPTSDGARQRMVMAIPPGLASDVRYAPALPLDHRFLLQRVPAGAVIKTVAIYDEPFWRNDGLSGETVSIDSPISITLDSSSEDGRPGLMSGYAMGPHAGSSARCSRPSGTRSSSTNSPAGSARKRCRRWRSYS